MNHLNLKRSALLLALAVSAYGTAAAQVNTVSVNPGSGNGTDTFNTIGDALASFATGGPNVSVNSDATDNVINIDAFGPYDEQFVNIDSATLGTDNLIIQGSNGSDRPLILVQQSADGADGLNIEGAMNLTLNQIIIAASDTGTVITDDLIEVNGTDSSLTFTNSVMTSVDPSGTTAYSSYTQESDIPADLLDGTRAFDNTLIYAGDNGFRLQGDAAPGTTTIIEDSIVAQQNTDPIVSFSGGPDANLEVRRTTIAGNANIGIQIAEQGTLLVEDSIITNNGGIGIALFDGVPSITVHDTEIYNNSLGIFVLNGVAATYDFNDLLIYDNGSWGLQCFSDSDPVSGIANSTIYNNGSASAASGVAWGTDGGNIEFLGDSATTFLIDNCTIANPAAPSDVNIRIGRPGDSGSAPVVIQDSVIAGGTTAVEILDASDVTIVNSGIVTAGPDATTNAVINSGPDAETTAFITNEDPGFADSANGDFTPSNFDYAGIGDAVYAFAGTEQNAEPAFDASDALNGAVGTILLGNFLVGPDGDDLTELTDGTNAGFGGALEGLARDNPGNGTPSVSIAYDLVGNNTTVADVSSVSVTSGWQDGRSAHHYDLLYTTDYPVDGSSTWYSLAKTVTAVPFGSAYPGSGAGDYWYYLSNLTDGDDGLVADDITGLRFDIYAIGNTTNAYVDPYGSADPLDVDGSGSGPSPAAEGAWIREIDVDFTTTTPVGDWMILDQ